MLSLTCKTAIKAVIFLASKNKTADKSSLKEVAEFINASEHSVGKILQVLVKDGIINSTKGPTGGFFITDQQLQKTLLEVVYAIDGNEVFSGCGLGLQKCSSTHPCPIHDEYKTVRNAFEHLCKEKTIQDLGTHVQEGISYLID